MTCDGTYGSPRIADELRDDAWAVSTKTVAASMTTLPEQLRRSLSWDRGKEFSAHAAFTVETNIPAYFADPNSDARHNAVRKGQLRK